MFLTSYFNSVSKYRHIYHYYSWKLIYINLLHKEFKYDFIRVYIIGHLFASKIIDILKLMDEVMSSLVFLLAKLRTVCDGNMTNNMIIHIYTF